MVEKRHKAVLRVSLIELLCQEAKSIFRYSFDHLQRGASPLGRFIFLNLYSFCPVLREFLSNRRLKNVCQRC